MNTEEAIEFCKNQQNYNYNGQNEEIQRALRIFNCGLDEVITLLMRGSAFEKMFREVENMYGSSLTWDIEQKYFPSEIINK